MGRNECGSNAMVTVQMTVEEYLEMKSRQDVSVARWAPSNPLCPFAWYPRKQCGEHCFLNLGHLDKK